MPIETVKKYLDENNVKYVSLSHSPAYTAQEVAHTTHVSGKKFAKTVMVKVDGELAMVVLPASENVDFNSIAGSIGAEKVELATESDFRDRFPGCELGAMPPFGNLFDMKVYVTSDMKLSEKIAFNAGSHSELIQMTYDDFERLVDPVHLS